MRVDSRSNRKDYWNAVGRLSERRYDINGSG